LMAPNLLIDTACAIVALGLAALTLRFVENPIRYGTVMRNRTNAAVVAMGTTAIALVAAVAAAVLLWNLHGPHSAQDQLAMQIANDRPGVQYKRCLLNPQSVLSDLTLSDCRFGDPKQPITLALWGDSHAWAWAPMLSATQSRGAPAFKLYSLVSCQPLLKGPGLNGKIDQCHEFNRRTLDEIIALKGQGLKGVILSGRWVTLRHPSISRYDAAREHIGIRSFFRQYRIRRSGVNVAPTDDLDSGLSSTLRALNAAGIRVLILLDPPEVMQPIPECVFVHFSDVAHCGISRAVYDEYTLDVRNTINQFPVSFPAVRVLDPTLQFCDHAYCPPMFRNGPTLFDDDHISTSTAREFAPAARIYIDWLIGTP